MDPSFFAQQASQRAERQALSDHQQAMRHGYQHGHRPPAHTPVPHRGGRGGGLLPLLVVIVVVVVFARDPELRRTVLDEIHKLVSQIQNG